VWSTPRPDRFTSGKGSRYPQYEVGITTRYWLDGQGIESRCGLRISTLVHTGCETHPAFYTMGTRSFPGLKVRGVDHPPPSSAEVKERIEQYLYSPSGPSRAVIG
jgi:hypothetical protein